MARLILEHSNHVIKDHPFTKKSITIGRQKDNTIILEDVGVSSYHARIDKRGVDYILTDLQSTNGTFVNDTDIVSYRLSHGDKIMIGEHTLLFVGTEIAKAHAEQEKLDLNKTMIRGASEKRRIPYKPQTITRKEITTKEVEHHRFLGRLTPFLLGVLIMCIGGWTIVNHKPALLKSILPVILQSDVGEKETRVASKHPFKVQSSAEDSNTFRKELPPRPIPQATEGTSGPSLSENGLSNTISIGVQERSASQSWEKTEGKEQNVLNSIGEPELVLRGIVFANNLQDSFAVINGRMVKVGGSVAGVTVTEISKRYVVIQSPKSNTKLKLTLK